MSYIFIILLFNNRICSHLPGSTLSKTKFPNQDFSGQTTEIEETEQMPKSVYWTTKETPCIAYGIFSIEKVLCKILYSLSSLKQGLAFGRPGPISFSPNRTGTKLTEPDPEPAARKSGSGRPGSNAHPLFKGIQRDES